MVLCPGGDAHIKVRGMLVRKFKLNSQGRTMWVCLKLKLGPKGDFCVVSVRVACEATTGNTSAVRRLVSGHFCKFLYVQY